MNFSKIAKKTLRNIIFAAMTMTAAQTVAQDRLAMAAPVDRRMRSIDSISLVRMLAKEKLTNPAATLYPEWNNKYTTHFGVELPKEYKIDLRHFHMPCDSRLITSHFGWRSTFHRNHYGTDIKVYIGDTIRAAFSGKVRIVAYNRSGYGKYVIIRHGNGLETVYGHMSKQLVKEDQIVKAGEPIGLGGNTGRSTGSHLHFETRFLGQFIDPEKMFDFVAQDVKADYYTFRSNGHSEISVAEVEKNGGEGAELTDAQVAVAEQEIAQKKQESRNFQQKRRSEVRQHIHKVASGENLSTIAKKCGTTVDKLCKMNNISKTSLLRPGQILKYS